jgi:ABC-type dipeptide/oligopeptide/nickel transport system ATPase component
VIDVPKAQFYSSPLSNIHHFSSISQDPVLRAALENDVSAVVSQDIEFRIAHQLNFILSIIGATGSGKSTIGQWLYSIACQASGQKPNVDDIIFEQTELLERLKSVYTGHTFVIDEHFTVRTGVGAYREQEIMNWIQQIVRAYQLNFIFCCPLEVNKLSHYLLKTLDIDYQNSMNRSIVHSIDIEPNGFIRIDPIGYLLSPYTEIPGYQEKKMSFIRDRLKQEGTSLHKKHKKIAEEVMEKYDIAKNTPFRVVRVLIEELEPGLAENEYEKIADYVRSFSMMKKKESKKPKKGSS